MANRSFFYLKNDQSSRILSEGVYQIPLFWQCLWTSQDLLVPIAAWKEAFSLVEREGEEALEAFLETAQLDILVSQETYRKNAANHRAFIEAVFPNQLTLYDQFLAFVDANLQDGDLLGFDVTEIVDMGEPEEAEAELLSNQEALASLNKDLLGPNTNHANLIYADLTGYTESYLEDLSPENRLEIDGETLVDWSQEIVDHSQYASQDPATPVSEIQPVQESKSNPFSHWGWIFLVILLVRLLLKFLV